MDDAEALLIARDSILALAVGDPEPLRRSLAGASAEDGAAIAGASARLAARALVELDAVLGDGAGLAFLTREVGPGPDGPADA